MINYSQMDLSQKIKLLQKTLLKMGTFIRMMPPASLDIPKEVYEKCGLVFEEYVSLLAGGTIRDPEGKEFIYYFMTKALEELEGEENDNSKDLHE